MKEEHNLLLEMSEKGKMSFREVFPFVIPNPNRAQTVLSKLIKKKLIRQETENWKRGQKKIYSVTEKGLLQCYQLDVTSINESIKRLQKTTSGLLAPNILQRFRQDIEVPLPKYYPEDIDPKTPARIDVMNDEELEQYSEENKELFDHREKMLGELHHIFFDLAKVLMTVDGPTVVKEDLSDVEIGFRNKRPIWMVLPSTS